MAKLLYPHGAWQEDSVEHSVCIAAFRMFAFNIAFDHPEFKQMPATLKAPPSVITVRVPYGTLHRF